MKWTCPKCEEVLTINSPVDHERIEHLRRVHNATPAEWTEAYNRIQAGRERAKKRDKDDATA